MLWVHMLCTTGTSSCVLRMPTLIRVFIHSLYKSLLVSACVKLPPRLWEYKSGDKQNHHLFSIFQVGTNGVKTTESSERRKSDLDWMVQVAISEEMTLDQRARGRKYFR